MMGVPGLSALWRLPETALSALFIGGRRRPFRSPLHAQLWYEWRRRDFLLPYVVGFAALIIAAIVLVNVERLPGGMAGADFVRMILFIPCMAAGFVALIRFALGTSQDNSWQKNFLFVHPATTQWLACTRLLSAALTVAATAALLLFALLVVMIFNQIEFSAPGTPVALMNSQDLEAFTGAFGGAKSQLLIVLLMAAEAFVLCWLFLSSGILAPVAAAGLGNFYSVYEFQHWDSAISYAVFATLIMAASIWALTAARRKRVLLGGWYTVLIVGVLTAILLPLSFMCHNHGMETHLDIRIHDAVCRNPSVPGLAAAPAGVSILAPVRAPYGRGAAVDRGADARGGRVRRNATFSRTGQNSE
jgi:hypothetical protein